MELGKWTRGGMCPDGLSAKATAEVTQQYVGYRGTVCIVEAIGGYDAQFHLDRQATYLNQANVIASGRTVSQVKLQVQAWFDLRFG